MGHCHCSMCRKFHGAAFASYAEVSRANFSWLAGEQLLQEYIASNGTTRRFCSECGSSMTFSPANSDGQVIEVSVATMDTEIAERPDAHIFVANKANWYSITDDLPQHASSRRRKSTNDD